MGQYKPSQTQTLSTETMCLQSMQGHYSSMTGYCGVKAQKSTFIIHFIHILTFWLLNSLKKSFSLLKHLILLGKKTF